jgi:hypothetical protein
VHTEVTNQLLVASKTNDVRRTAYLTGSRMLPDLGVYVLIMLVFGDLGDVI